MGPSHTPSFALESHPSRYRYWQLVVEPPLATLLLTPGEDVAPGLLMDIELADAVNRLRFEHPEIRVVVLTGGEEQAFRQCQFTAETLLAIEDASAHSGQHYLAACGGAAAGAGYELALACDEIYLVDDGASAVSLAIPPAPGAFARLLDKRKVRRDLADLFCTSHSGLKGRHAVDWRLVDGVFPRARFDEAVRERALALAAGYRPPKGNGVRLEPLEPTVSENSVAYRYVALSLDRGARTAELTVQGPAGDAFEWPLRTFREIDDALLRLRFHYREIAVLLLKTHGSLDAVRRADEALFQENGGWLIHEILLLMARTLRRLDLMPHSLFALVERDSCFAGSLLELALAADRTYMLRDEGVRLGLTALNGGSFPMSHGLSRLAARRLPEPAAKEPLDAARAAAEGLVTAALDEIDWDEEVRAAVEERIALPPDSLAALQAGLRPAANYFCRKKFPTSMASMPEE